MLVELNPRHDIDCFNKRSVRSSCVDDNLRGIVRSICFSQRDLRASNIIQQEQCLDHLVQPEVSEISRLATGDLDDAVASLSEGSLFMMIRKGHRDHA